MAAKKYAYVNHEMLVWARSTTPFETTMEVQEMTKIASSKIDAWEKGEDYPSITEAKKLANLYHDRIHNEIVLLTNIPKAFDQITSHEIYLY